MKLTDKRVWISFLSAALFCASAVSALAVRFGHDIKFIPSFLGYPLALRIFLLLAGILLLYDAFSVRNFKGHVRISYILTGFIMAFLGAFPLMNQMGMLNFLPFVVEFTLGPTVLAGLLLFYSFYLIWDVYIFLRP